MGGIAGIEIKAAFKKAATWGTAVACGANNGILILPSSIKKDSGVDIDDSLGLGFPGDGTPGAIKAEGDLPAYLRYDSLDLLIALVLGTAGAPAQQGGSAAYAYTYKPAAHTDGLFATAARNLKNYIQEMPSIKFTGFTIKGEFGKALQIIFHTTCNNIVYDSTTNTLATFNNVTYFESMNRVKFSEGVFRMNAQSGSALAEGDKVYPSSFELSFKRKLTGVYDGRNRATSGSNIQDCIDEPTNDGIPECKLKLGFPRHSGTTNLGLLAADTRQKMDITFTGGLIASTYYRTFKLQFPHLQLASVDIADEQGIIKEPVEFNVYGALTAPAGMTGITDPFWVTGINRLSTNPLA